MPNVKSLAIFSDPVNLVGNVKLAAGAGITLIRDDASNAIAIVTTPAAPPGPTLTWSSGPAFAPDLGMPALEWV